MKIGIIGAMDEEIVELKNSMTDINEIQSDRYCHWNRFSGI